MDPNSILDIGCPRSVGGAKNAKALCKALGIKFLLESLDCTPFYHGCGSNCRDEELLNGMWRLPVKAINGVEAKFPFYMVPGEGVLLLGNEIHHKLILHGPENLMVIPPGVGGIANEELVLQTYHVPIKGSDENAVRTILSVIPAQLTSFKAFFTSYRAFHTSSLISSSTNVIDYSDGKVAKAFAAKLHGFTHLPFDDMVELCKKGGVLTPVLRQALQSAYNKWTPCLTTGRPLRSRKVSLRRLLSSFNDHIQIDFVFLRELNKMLTMHIVDSKSCLSVAKVVTSRELDEAVRIVETEWFNVYGPPLTASSDPEFAKDPFLPFLKHYEVKFEPRPARRHNKIRIAESKNNVLRTLNRRLVKDADYFKTTRGTSATPSEILSRSVFLANILYGDKRLSSFEMVHGYTPSPVGLPKTQVSQEMMDAHEEQSTRRALQKFKRSEVPRTLPPSSFPRRTAVYYFKRGVKFGEWKLGYVRDAYENILNLSSNAGHRGNPILTAYEDVRLAPQTSLLLELDSMGFLFPRSTSTVDRHEVSNNEEPREDASAELEATQGPIGTPAYPNATTLFSSERTLWVNHPQYFSFLGSQVTKQVELTERDIGARYSPPSQYKDIGDTEVNSPTCTAAQLESDEQNILQKIKKFIGDNTVSERKLNFAPQWIIDKAIAKEKDKYDEFFEEVKINDLPKDANLITSHHFFQFKSGGTKGKLKLKCRLVPHGNKDK